MWSFTKTRKQRPLRALKSKDAMSKTKKRFTNEQQILDAIDECHHKAKAYTMEANQCEVDAQAMIKRAYDLEQETIALSAFKALPSPLVAVETECARWHLPPPILCSHLKEFGMNQDNEPLSGLHPDTLRWVCANWPRVLQYHIGYLRRIAGEKTKLAKRRRTGADNQINGKAVELGKLLAVMRTEAMAFLSDSSIPAA